MKILKVMGYPLANSSTLDTYMLEASKVFRNLGHEMHLLYDGPKNTELTSFIGELEKHCIMHWFPYPQQKRKLYKARLKRLLKESQYDIVHLYFEPAAYIGAWMSFWQHVPIVIRTIGSYPLLSEGKSSVYRLFEKLYWNLKHMPESRLICVSEGMKDYIQKNYRYHSRKLYVIYNATDATRFIPSNNRIVKKQINKQEHIRVTFLGRLEPIKGLEIFIDALKSLSDRYPNLCSQIIGDGSLCNELKRRIADNGLSNIVSMPGRRHDLVDILHKTDIYVQPSYMEGFGSSVAEAMACGVPVVASAVGGIKELIRNGVDGLLVQPGNSKHLAESITRLISDEKLYNEIRINARERIINKFDYPVKIKNELGLYKQLYNAHQNRRL